MTVEDRAKAIFLNALEIASVEERLRFLEQQCGQEQGLRAEVEGLLCHHQQLNSFLLTPAFDPNVTEPPDESATRHGPASGGPDDPIKAEAAQWIEPLSLDFLTPSDDPQTLGRIGDYTVTEVIGRGGMGIVLKARDASLDRVVAIKVLAPELASNATARKRFLREAKTAAAVTHQHVVTIHAVGEDRLPYLVMECVSGQSLQDKLDQQGPLELREVLRIGTQVASGLAAAHAHGVIHRDIKPANILLENGIERVRITDFGLARAVDDVAMTRTGEVAGTPQYMSPEQAQGQPVDARSDLFSFGSVLYAMCTGRPPFRAETTIDAIRRVCDDTPRPIREINGEVPEWLTAIIDRLLAKRPEDRFQTANEVAQLLGKHLAHVQDPGSTPFPAITHVHKPGFSKKPGLSHRWVAAVVVLCAVLAALGVTEATGVTHLTGTVVRIVTGEGTLLIEIDDPTVQVSLDGEELTISGGGVEQVRLRPGQYQFVATRNGQPVKQELVTITRGDKRVVTVSREAVGQATVAPVVAAERGAFVVLGGEGVAERRFDTLAEAVESGSDGDTIEVLGDGPFVTEPISIQQKAITIRAAEGFRPVIKLSPKGGERGLPLLFVTNAALTLEGLELHDAPADGDNHKRVIQANGAVLRAANCRFRFDIRTYPTPGCTFLNCEFLSDVSGTFLGQYSPGARFIFENCVHRTGGAGLYLSSSGSADDEMSIEINRSTFVSKRVSVWLAVKSPLALATDRPQVSRPVRFEVTGSIFDTPSVLGFEQHKDFVDKAGALAPAEAEALLLRLIQWRGDRNLFPAGSTSVVWGIEGKKQPAHGPKSLEEWLRFWGAAEDDPLEGRVLFQGGNLLSRTEASIDQLTPDDFRLLEDSHGYRAGPDGKDLGADLDLVGPGPAYERWKKTPEYQEWLKETRQVNE